MPILVHPHAAAPLRQGDVLRSPGALYWTGQDGRPASASRQSEYVLVLSRNCRAVRANRVIVCPIQPQRLSGQLGSTYKEVRAQLEMVRDGARARDRFYLGQLDAQHHRHAAHLDELHLIEIPTKDDERRAYLETYRVWSLDRDFLYDLHARIYLSFARQGFDDDVWWSDRDLQLLLQLARNEYHQAEASLAKESASLNEAQGDDQSPPKKLSSLQRAVEGTSKKAEELGARVDELEREAKRRGLE